MASDGDAPAGSKTGQTLTYDEVRAVAQEIYRIERKMRWIRTGVCVASLLLALTVTLGFVMVFVFRAVEQTEVRQDRPNTPLALVEAGTDNVIRTAESLEDVDASQLIDYDSAAGDEGEWNLSDERLAMIRTISWKNREEMHVHHVAEVTRYDGQDARVVITTKANHKIRINVTDFDVEIMMFDPDRNTWDPPVEVSPEGADDDAGRGRVLVSLRRPSMGSNLPPIDIQNYFCDSGDECADLPNE